MKTISGIAGLENSPHSRTRKFGMRKPTDTRSNRKMKRITTNLRSLFSSAALILSMVIVGRVEAADTPDSPPVLRLPPCAKAPAIDGKITPGEWEAAFQGCGLIR